MRRREWEGSHCSLPHFSWVRIVFMTTKRWANTQCFWRANEPCSSPLASLYESLSLRSMQAAWVSWSTYYCIQGLLRERRGQGDKSRRDDSQLLALQMQRKTVTDWWNALTHYPVTQSIAGSWCVNITGSINLMVDLSLNRYVCVSLIGVDMGHFAEPWRNKVLKKFLSGWLLVCRYIH